MGNSVIFTEVVRPYGYIVLIVLGSALVSLAIYFMWAGKMQTCKKQDDEREED
jgi:hypothetical protein